MSPEALLREAFEHQAAQAPDADTVRREVLRRVAGSRRSAARRTWVAVPAAAAALTALVAVGAIAALRAPSTVTAVPGTRSSATPAPAPSSTAFLEVPLRWRPSGLPATFRESLRTVDVEPGDTLGTLTRTWQPSGAVDGGGGRLDLQVRATPFEIGDSTPVRVGTVTGRWVSGGDKAVLTWQIAAGQHVLLLGIGLGLDRAAMVRLAATVSEDAGIARFPVAMPTPAQTPPQTVRTLSVSWVDGTWAASLALGDYYRVEVQDRVSVPTAAQRVTVDGHPAYYVPDVVGTGASLVVQLDGGRGLTVHAARASGPDPLIALARSVSWEPPTPF